MTENLEKIQTEQAPSPVTQTAVATAPVTAPVSEPTISTVEDQNKKQTAAFIRMRQEKRELKEQLAKATANVTPPPVAVVEPQAIPVPVVPPAPVAVQTVSGIEAEGRKAIEEMAMDKDVQSVPGAVMDILDMLDRDPRLERLYSIDPVIALREAKYIWASKAGIAPSPSVPLPSNTSGGMASGKQNLEALYREIEKHSPGTKEYSELVTQINKAME